MTLRDPLYGAWELPYFIERLVKTKEMVRLRKISQMVMPNHLMSYSTIPSRFHHGLGVCYLAFKVLGANPNISDYRFLLPMAALLHDAGNPPFSHLSEYFLKEVTGKNGESFLENILEGSETEKILHELGTTSAQIVNLVTGNTRPISEVLNGSLDIDNLDNIGRFNYAVGLQEKFNAIKIASSFRFLNNKWVLAENCKEETMKWKNARAAAYGVVYGNPHLNAGMMLYRALEIAFVEEEIFEEFFFKDDYDALEYLSTHCNSSTRTLIDRVTRWQWYDEIFSYESVNPNSKVKTWASHWQWRYNLAEKIVNKLNVGREQICVHIGKGKDKRKIHLPFIKDNGQEFYDTSDDSPIYRVKIYAPKTLLDNSKIKATKELALQEIG